MKNSVILIVLLVLFSVFLIGWRTVELTATWDPNTEADMSCYNLYLVKQGGYQKTNDAPIPHPTTSYTFKLKLPDDSVGPLCFALTAVDTSGNESGYSKKVCVGQ